MQQLPVTFGLSKSLLLKTQASSKLFFTNWCRLQQQQQLLFNWHQAVDPLPANIRAEDVSLDLSSLTKSDSDVTTASDFWSFEVTSAENSSFF
jgi:hypothetical protein